MLFTNEEVANLIQRASSLYERLDQPISQNVLKEPEAYTKLQGWCKNLAFGDWGLMQNRLSLSNWTHNDLLNILNDNSYIPSIDKIPEWLILLIEILNNAEQYNKKSQTLVNHDKIEISEKFLLPFIIFSRQNLKFNSSIFSEKAISSLTNSLWKNLYNISSHVIQREIALYKISYRDHTSTNTNFHSYMWEQGGIKNLFLKYPVLGRLIGLTIKFWINNTNKLLYRIEHDLPEIRNYFFGSKLNSEYVSDIVSELSDPHKSHQAVQIIIFSNDAKIVYKPRNLNIAYEFNELINFFNEQSNSISLKSLKVISHSEYGWMEFVKDIPCENKIECQECCKRIGFLMCLVYFLRGTDCHSSNLIIEKENPILIDLETLIYQDINYSKLPSSSNQDLNSTYSVLNTGVLPTYSQDHNDEVHDTSGIGKVITRISSNEKLTNYFTDIITGFKEMYLFLAKDKNISKIQNFLLSIAEENSRFILRPTRIYGAITKLLLQPKYLMNGINRSIAMDMLSRGFLYSHKHIDYGAILKAEHLSLEQLDIPYFFVSNNKLSLQTAQGYIVPHVFKQSGLSIMFAHLKQINSENLTRQLSIIDGALTSIEINTNSEHFSISTEKITPIHQSIPLGIPNLINESIIIGDEIINNALKRDNKLSWMTFEYNFKSGHSQFRPMKGDLYTGFSGVALFFSALASVTKKRQYFEIVQNIISPFSKIYQYPQYKDQLIQYYSIGGADGVGSIIYALAQIAHLTNNELALDISSTIATSITDEKILSDTRFDVISGASGAILGLLKLYSLTKNQDVLDKAILCGEHLLENQTYINKYKGWKTLNKNIFLTGISHGTAGIAYSLLRLYEFTDDMRFLQAGKDSLKYEHHVYSEKHRNWPDFRKGLHNGKVFQMSWCHGAPGVGLARLGGLHVLNTSDITQEIEASIDVTIDYGIGWLDRLCCGNYGRIELLLHAGYTLKRKDLLDTAFIYASTIVQNRRNSTGYNVLNSKNINVSDFSLFRGVAGIGYQLLRCAKPNEIPSVLIWN